MKLRGDVKLFTDELKMESVTGSEVFVDLLNIEKAYKSDDDNSVFQAEV